MASYFHFFRGANNEREQVRVDLTRTFVHMNVIGISRVPSKEERVLCRYFDM